jgi:hypothetical protein
VIARWELLLWLTVSLGLALFLLVRWGLDCWDAWQRRRQRLGYLHRYDASFARKSVRPNVWRSPR